MWGLSLGQQHQAVGALPLRVVGWEVLADIAEGEGPQQGIHDRVHEHVGIAVAVEPQSFGMLQPLAPQDQWPSRHQPMDVVAVADPQVLHGLGRASR